MASDRGPRISEMSFEPPIPAEKPYPREVHSVTASQEIHSQEREIQVILILWILVYLLERKICKTIIKLESKYCTVNMPLKILDHSLYLCF